MMSRSILRCVDWEPTFRLRSKQSERLWRRKAVDDVWACNFWCQLLSVFVERRPRRRDPALDFSRFFLDKRDSVTKKLHAFVSSHYFGVHVISFKMLFCVRVDGALVAESHRLVWVDPESYFLCCILETTKHFQYLLFGSCEQYHIVGKSEVRDAVMIVVAQVFNHSFSSLPSLNFVLQWVLENRVE